MAQEHNQCNVDVTKFDSIPH